MLQLSRSLPNPLEKAGFCKGAASIDCDRKRRSSRGWLECGSAPCGFSAAIMS